MYVYIFDDFTSQKKYQKSIQQISKKLTDLGLNGKTIRMEITKNLASSIEDEIRRGAKTIIAVGNDKTTLKTLNAIVSSHDDEKNNISLGIIPLEPKESRLATVLGINNTNDACEIILARRLTTLNTASLGENYFLFRAVTVANDISIELDKNFTVQPEDGELVKITNDPTKEESTEKKLTLEIKRKNSESLFYFKEAMATNQKTPIILDGCLPVNIPAKISVKGERIKVIVGKNRTI